MYYEQNWFLFSVVIYVILGIITAIICYKESKTLKLSTFEWTLFGYFLPIIPFILLKKKQV